jgi:hypothetical protein
MIFNSKDSDYSIVFNFNIYRRDLDLKATQHIKSRLK